MGNNGFINSTKRTALIIVCAVLIVLCLLILPWFCSSGATNNVPSQPVPIKPDPIHVEPTVPVGPNAQSRPNDSAVIEEHANQENPDHISNSEPITETTNQKDIEPAYIEPTTPTSNAPDLTNATSLTEPDLQGDSSPTASDEPGSTEPIAQEEPETTPENPQFPNSERQKDEGNQTSLRNPRVVPRNIPVEQTDKGGGVSQEEQPLSPISPNNNVNSGESRLILWVVILIILLIGYIIARVRSKNGVLVITANIFDKILIILSPILFFVAWCIGFDHELTPFQIILLVLSGLMLIGSILFSVFANLGNVFHAIISILAKIFIFIFTNFLLLLLVVIVVFSFMRAVTSHDDTEGTYVVKYDHFLDQWVGYRID